MFAFLICLFCKVTFFFHLVFFSGNFINMPKNIFLVLSRSLYWKFSIVNHEKIKGHWHRRACPCILPFNRNTLPDFAYASRHGDICLSLKSLELQEPSIKAASYKWKRVYFASVKINLHSLRKSDVSIMDLERYKIPQTNHSVLYRVGSSMPF